MRTILEHGINRLEDWLDKAPPKGGAKQWKEGYSAKEFAKLWFDDKGQQIVPNDIQAFCEKVFGRGFEVLFAEPERVTKLDTWRGGQRNHDMAMLCKKSNGGQFLVCIEAKVAEPLGSTVEGQWKKGSKSKSHIQARIREMTERLLMNSATPSSCQLQYQLFTGVVGTIKEAENLNVKDCLFLVLQIVPPNRTIATRVDATRASVVSFLKTNGAKPVFGSIDDNREFACRLNCKDSGLEPGFQVMLGYLCTASKNTSD